MSSGSARRVPNGDLADIKGGASPWPLGVQERKDVAHAKPFEGAQISITSIEGGAATCTVPRPDDKAHTGKQTKQLLDIVAGRSKTAKATANESSSRAVVAYRMDYLLIADPEEVLWPLAARFEAQRAGQASRQQSVLFGVGFVPDAVLLMIPDLTTYAGRSVMTMVYPKRKIDSMDATLTTLATSVANVEQAAKRRRV
ncbi:hypothetical protein FN846DRAFT_903711 [Sphaerosporella brunnea]|uniref:Uncharacterized protein n=1 Tax=Sphaerosporella brunnea TaxID=1250544 RepID=A0A5J5F6U3_9PEZI|nr:hypothetical protein FN846DRAFT_903711 [Sphaerosporella brunnea]